MLLTLALDSPFFLLIRHQQTKLKNIYQTTALIRNCIGYSMLTGDMDGVQEILLRVADDESILLFRLFNSDMEEVFNTSPEPPKFSNEVQLKATTGAKKSIIDDRINATGRIWYYVPLILEEKCAECHDNVLGNVLGIIETNISTMDLIAQTKSNTTLLANIGGVILILIGGTLYVFIQKMVHTPIIAMVGFTLMMVLDVAFG